MKRSTNFEFMRERASVLAEAAAAVEMHSHDADPRTALAEVRRFAEALLKLFVAAEGSEASRNAIEKTFEQILQECRRDIPDEQWLGFDRLRFELNKVVHDTSYRPNADVSDYLREMWEIGKWVWATLGYGGPAEGFRDPPRGGEDLAAMRQDRDEAMRAAARPVVDLTHWIRRPLLDTVTDFVPRDWILRQVLSLLDVPTTRILLLEGQPGRGKTTVLMDFLKRWIPEGVEPIAYFFVDAHSRGEPRAWARHLYASVLRLGGISEREWTIEQADAESLVQKLRARLAELERSAPKLRFLFVLDALDESGPCSDTVSSFVYGDLPANCQIVATARPGYLAIDRSAGLAVMDLENPDVLNSHRNDGRRYVQAITEGLPDGAIDDLARCGNGNFLVLRELCQQLPGNPLEIQDYTASLTLVDADRGTFEDELYRRSWQRLDQLGPAERDIVNKVFSLFAVSRDSLSATMVKETLGIRDGHWKAVLKMVAAYLHHSEILPPFVGDVEEETSDPTAKPLTVYRLFHQAFREFVRSQLPEELVQAEVELARQCRKWLQSKKQTYQQAYALRYVVQHFENTQGWIEVTELLFDLEFIQARFEANLGDEFSAEYDRILPQHPAASDAFLRRVRRDLELREWVDDLVRYASKCTDIRKAFARGQIADAMSALRDVSFPVPPDSSLTIDRMRATEHGDDLNEANDRGDNEFDTLLAFQRFIATQMELLIDAPSATIDIARNYASAGSVADAARRFDKTRSKRARLLSAESRAAPRMNPLVLRSVGHQLPRNRTELRAWMTPDARFAYVRVSDSYFGTIDNLCTGENLWSVLTAEDRSGEPIAMSVDGRWVVMQCFNPQRVELIDMRGGRSVGSTTRLFADAFGTTCDVTPDGNRVVGIADGALVVWDVDDNNITKIDIGDFKPTFLLLCMSGAVASITDEQGGCFQMFDLVSGAVLPAFEALCDDVEDPDSSRDRFSVCDVVYGQWFEADYWVSCRQRFGDQTADGEVELIPWRFLVDVENVPPELLMSDSELDKDTWPVWTIDSTDKLVPVRVPNGITWDDLEGVTRVGDCASERRPPVWGHPSEPALVVERCSRRVIRRFDDFFPLGKIDTISADGRYALAHNRDAFVLLDLECGRREHERPKLTWDDDDAAPVNDALQTFAELDLSVTVAQSREDDRSSGVLLINPQRKAPAASEYVSNVCHLITPDLSRLVVERQDNRSLEPNADNAVPSCSDSSRNDRIPAVSTVDLVTGALTELDKGFGLAGLLCDGTSVVLLPSSKSATDQLLFWSIDGRYFRQKSIELHATYDARNGVYVDPFDSPLVQSPDGRSLILRKCSENQLSFQGGPLLDLRLNIDEGFGFPECWANPHPEGGSCLRFSPDSRFLLVQCSARELDPRYGIILYVFSMTTHECVGVSFTTSFLEAIDCDGHIVGENNQQTGLHVDDPERRPAWVTGARIYRPYPNGALIKSSDVKLGTFEERITFRCKRCGRRSPFPVHIVERINAIHRNAGLDALSSPILELPDEAWDRDTRLNFSCPECRQPHRSTPFYIDQQTR